MADESPQPNVLGSGSLRALSPLFWLLVVATGVGAGVGGGLLMLLLRAVQRLSWPYRPGDNFLSAVQNAGWLRVICILTAAGFLSGAIGLLLRQQKSSGHGSELAETIWFGSARLAPVRTLVRAIQSIVIVGMGASLGREAAPKQTGALVASMLAQWAEIPASQRRLLVACGAGAGMAAVYNVPFGGAMFALEVLLGTISLPLVPPALAAALIATAVSWLMLPNVATYDIPFYPVTADQIVWAVIAGPVAGLASVAYVRLISWSAVLRPRGAVVLIAPIAVFCGLGVLAVRYPQLLGNGKDTVQLVFLGQLGLPLLVALMLLKPIATAACLGSGAPGGLFTPTLTLGAVLGGVLGHVWQYIWPGSPIGVFGIIGACAVLAASTQGPVSAVVLVIELTRRLETLIVPTILATAGAVLVARLLEHRSIYSARIHLGRSAAGRAVGEKEEKGFIAVSAAALLPELLTAMLRSVATSRPVYIVNESGQLEGQVPADRVRDPAPETFPLETTTAADFATPVQLIFNNDDETTIAAKFKSAGRHTLPIIDKETGELIGVHHSLPARPR